MIGSSNSTAAPARKLEKEERLDSGERTDKLAGVRRWTRCAMSEMIAAIIMEAEVTAKKAAE